MRIGMGIHNADSTCEANKTLTLLVTFVFEMCFSSCSESSYFIFIYVINLYNKL